MFIASEAKQSFFCHFRVFLSGIQTLVFILNCLGPLPQARADEFRLPAPGVMVHLSPEFNPPILKGIKVHPDNPFQFDFILDQGDSYSSLGVRTEATRLIKYFLASLTIPENDLWVNLSPYEKNRIIPQSFGLTEMGRDLLAEDYMLKQITASLIYPEGEIGKKFWKRIYQEAAKKFGTTNIPVNTFNKVWIVPDKAVIYENETAGTAYVVDSKLKVMLEEDYLSMQKHGYVGVAEGGLRPLRALGPEGASPASAGFREHAGETRGQDPNINSLGSEVIREIVIPELTKEVNEDKNFTQLRQVYNSLILATWYKKKIKDSILAQVYADKNKIKGTEYINSVKTTQKNGTNDVEFIYQRYLQAFKKGVYNYIKEDMDPLTQQPIPRKYFSGGMSMYNITTHLSYAMTVPKDQAMTNPLRLVVKLVTEVYLRVKKSGSGGKQSVNDFQRFFKRDFGFVRSINDLQTRLDKRLGLLESKIKESLTTPSDSREALNLLAQIRYYSSFKNVNQLQAENRAAVYRNHLQVAINQSSHSLQSYFSRKDFPDQQNVQEQLKQAVDLLEETQAYTDLLSQMFSLIRAMDKLNGLQPQLQKAVGQYQHEYEGKPTPDFDPNIGVGMELDEITKTNRYMQQGDMAKALLEWGRIYGQYKTIQTRFDQILLRQLGQKDKRLACFFGSIFQAIKCLFWAIYKVFRSYGIKIHRGRGRGRAVSRHTRQ